VRGKFEIENHETPQTQKRKQKKLHGIEQEGEKNEGTTFSFMTFDTNTVNNKIGDY
jgi:hypothetical protein